MANSRFYSSVAVANTIGTGGGLSASSTSLQGTTNPVGYPTSFPFTIRLEPGTANEELVSVTAGSGTAATPWTITRGFDGTTAVAHNNGAAFAHGSSAFDFTTSRTHEALGSGSGAHGLPSSAWATANIAVISEQLLAATATVITFSSISQVYNHLLLIAQARSNSGASRSTTVSATVNSDTTLSYSWADINTSNLNGVVSNPAMSSASAQGKWNSLFKIAAAAAGAGVNAGGGWCLFPNYAGTSLNKMFIGQSGMGDGTSADFDADLYWGWYNPTSQAGITTLALSVAAGSFVVGSFFGLYGLS